MMDKNHHHEHYLQKGHDHNHHHDQEHDHHQHVHSTLVGHHHHVHGEGKNILWAFALNFGLGLVELAGGYFTNSVAISSDAIHDLSDSVALLFSYFAERVSLKDPDHKFTFGYRRISVLSALVNGIVLLTGSLFVMIEAIKRFQSPETVNAQGMVGFAVLGVCVNGYAAFKLSRNEGINSRMIALHLLEDILGWVAVLIVSIILLFQPWYFLDSVLSLLIAFVILRGVIKNFYRIGSILLQSFPEHVDREDLMLRISKLELVEDVHFLQGWSMDDTLTTVTLHIRVSAELKVKEIDHLRFEIEDILSHSKIRYSTIQFESNECQSDIIVKK